MSIPFLEKMVKKVNYSTFWSKLIGKWGRWLRRQRPIILRKAQKIRIFLGKSNKNCKYFVNKGCYWQKNSRRILTNIIWMCYNGRAWCADGRGCRKYAGNSAGVCPYQSGETALWSILSAFTNIFLRFFRILYERVASYGFGLKQGRFGNTRQSVQPNIHEEEHQ